MAERGAQLQKYVTDLVETMEHLKGARDEIHAEISDEMRQKEDTLSDISSLEQRLTEVNANLEKKYNAKEEFDKTISDVEGAFNKIVESSQTLLHVMKKENHQLQKKKENIAVD